MTFWEPSGNSSEYLTRCVLPPSADICLTRLPRRGSRAISWQGRRVPDDRRAPRTADSVVASTASCFAADTLTPAGAAAAGVAVGTEAAELLAARRMRMTAIDS